MDGTKLVLIMVGGSLAFVLLFQAFGFASRAGVPGF